MSAPVPMNFAQFLVSLGSSAMAHLGEAPDPASGQRATNPAMASHTLALLQLLKEKTNGNLTSDEDRLLEALLSEIGGKISKLES